MMFPGKEPVRPPPEEDWLALQDAVTRFDDAWRQGPRPVIDDYLPAPSPLPLSPEAGERGRGEGAGLRYRLLIELVHIDLEFRLKAGESARVEEYLARYPELAGDAAALDLIAAEYELRRRGEPDLSLDEYLQ